MSYELEVDNILATGVDLLSPGDVGDGAVAVHNFRVDQGGQLRSRLGMANALSLSLGTYVHSIARVEAASPRRYFGADGNWFRNGVEVASGFDGNPVGMVSFQGRCWAMNRSRQLKDDGANTYAWTPVAPTGIPGSAGAVGGALTGDYSWWVTFIASDGSETNPSPALVVAALTNAIVTLTRPATVDAQITGWNVYRQGGSFPNQRYKVNPAPIVLATTTYADNGEDNTGAGGDDQTDNGIANLGAILAINHDPAPAAKFAALYNSRIFAFGTAANPNRMFWTEADEPAFFPGSGTNAGGNWADIGELGEEFIGAAVFPQVMLIIKSKSIWRLIGDASNGEIERLNVDLGGIGVKAWTVAGALVYFQSQEGIYKTTVSGTQIASPSLLPLFKGDAVEAYGAVPANPLDPDATARGRASMAAVNGRLYFSFASLGGNGYPDTTLVMNEKTGQWMTDSRGFTALFYEGNGGSLLGAINGNVYPLETGVTDAGAAIPLVYQSRFRDQKQPNVRKHYANLEIEHRLNGATLNVYVIFDGKGSTTTLAGTITSGSDRVWSALPLPDFDHGAEPRSISVRIELASAGSSYEELFAVVVRWYPVPLDGVVFDSGNISLASGQVCLVKNIEIDLENTGGGAVSYEFRSDLPGNQVQVRVPATTIANVVGIGTFMVDPAVTEARWVRLIVRVSSGVCRCLGARIQVRPIGTYLDGVSFDSGPFRVAAGGEAAQVQNLQLDIENTNGSAVTLDWYADLPGNALALVRANIAVTNGAGTGTFTVALPSKEARWARFVVRTANGVCRIFGARMEVRPIGLYLNGSGDNYSTPELTAGSPRMKLVGAIRVLAQNDGQIPLTLFSDLPAGNPVLADVADVAIPATADREWYTRRLPSTTRGKLLRIALRSPAVARIYAVLLRVKVLGESPSSWEWFSAPIPPSAEEWSKREIPVPALSEEWGWKQLPIA